LTTHGFELRDGGELSDLSPTVLTLLGLQKPPEMTGKDLVKTPAQATIT